MAKSSFGFGKFSGKVGGFVYAVRNGQQIIREKPVVVSNPKTNAQRLQRAKANLVGQISKITPYQILIGLGDNRPQRRSRFLRLALNSATASFSTSDPAVVLAKLDAPNFVFSEGALDPTISVTSATAIASSISVNLVRRSGFTDAEFFASGALVVVTFLGTNGDIESVFYRFVNSSEFTEGALTIQFNHSFEGAYESAVYVAPFSTQDGASLRSRAGQLFGEGANFNASMQYNPAALPVVWGNSRLQTVVSFTPTSAASSGKSKEKNI